MSAYSDNQAQNIVIPSSTVEAAIAAFAADRASQRQHEMNVTTTLVTFTLTAAERVIAFAREEAATRRADRTAEHLSLIEGLNAQVEKLTADNDRLQADLILSRQRPLSRAEG